MITSEFKNRLHFNYVKWFNSHIVSSQSVNTRFSGDRAKLRITINQNGIHFNQSIVNDNSTVCSVIYYSTKYNPFKFYLNVLTYFLTVLPAFNWASRRDYLFASLGCTCCLHRSVDCVYFFIFASSEVPNL